MSHLKNRQKPIKHRWTPIGVRVREDIWRLFKIAVEGRGIKLQHALTEAIKLWLGYYPSEEAQKLVTSEKEAEK